MTEENPNKWKSGRLWQTLTFFEVIPFLNCLQRLFTRRKQQSTNQLASNNMGIILVVGATGGVGKRVVRQLSDRGYRVRALVRDAAKAKTILGEKVELFEADITIPKTLTPPLMESVSAIICCTGTRVQPVEGDTPNREKYYQGIKFYLPKVVDTPKIVEYKGMQNLVKAAKKSKNLQPGERLLFDFKNQSQNLSQNLKETWGALDDVVMGGVSQSNILLADKTAVFAGNISTANSGGFASVRTRNFNPPWDLSNYQGIELRIKGDGKRYKFITRCEGKWDGIAYCYSFNTVSDFWTTIKIPFQDLIPVFRAKSVPDAGDFDSSTIYSMQFMLSKFEYDGVLNPQFEPGTFNLEIESIKAYGGKPTPQFILISSAGVTRPGRPGLNLAEEPPAVRMNKQLGGILTWKLRGEEVVRKSGLPYTIVRPCALTEKPGDKTLLVEQGDNMKGQVSREAIARLCVEAIELPSACNKTLEVRETGEPGTVNWQNLFNQLKVDS